MIYENQGSKKETMWKTEHTASFMQNICREDEREERQREGGVDQKGQEKKRTHIHPRFSWDNSGTRYTMGSVIPAEHLSIYVVMSEENKQEQTFFNTED